MNFMPYRVNALMLVLILVMAGVFPVSWYVLTTGMNLILKQAVVPRDKVIISIPIPLELREDGLYIGISNPWWKFW
jgi:hypothetical protein